MAKQSSTVLNNALNVPSVEHSELPFFLDRAREGVVSLMIHGTFGIGKSALMKAYAKQRAIALKLEYTEDLAEINNIKKFVMIVINLHQFDVSGFWLPVFMDDQYIQKMNSMFPTAGQGIIFFDEINLAPAMVQANAYNFILDRRLGVYTVPKGYSVFAAGNTVTDGANIHEMANPLKNRMQHFFLKVPTSREWADNYAIDAGVDHRIINFLLFAEHYMHKYNPEITENVFGIPTPRSWEFTSKVIKGVSHEGKDAESGNLFKLAGSCVGNECAREFVAFVKLSQDVDVDKIFKTGKMEIPTGIDMIYALMSAMIAYYMKKPEMAVMLAQLALLFKPEYTIILLKQAKAFDAQFIPRLRKDGAELFTAISKKYAKFLV